MFVLTRITGYSADRVDDKCTDGTFYMGDWCWDEAAEDFFLKNSVLLMVVIIAFAQLPSQLVASGQMLDFLELPYFPMLTVCRSTRIFAAFRVKSNVYVIIDTSGIPLRVFMRCLMSSFLLNW